MKVAEETVAGGYSGELTVTRAAGLHFDLPDMVFVSSDVQGMGLVLTLEQAANLAEVLRRISVGRDAKRPHLV